MSQRLRPTILNVNSRQVELYAISRILRLAGFEVIEASSAVEALARVRDGISLVVLEAAFTGPLDGLEICRRIRRLPTARRVSVVHLQGPHFDHEVHVKALEGGADACLTWPIEPPVLVATIKALLRIQAAEATLRASNERFAALVQAAPQAIFSLDERGRVASWNRAAEELWGWSEPEMVGRYLPVIFDLDSRQLEAWMAPILAGAKLVNEEVFCRRRDGLGLYISISIAPLLDERGTATGVMAVAVDITHRRAMQQQLADSSERFRATFEQVAVGLAHLALDGKWLRINQRLCGMLGYQHDELSRLCLRDILHPDDRGTGCELRTRLLSGEQESISREVRCTARDGGELWCGLTMSVVRDAAGKPAYFIAAFQDIQELKTAERKVENDVLTGLPNRHTFLAHLVRALERASCSRQPLAILLVDVDRFKTVNDCLCHAVGDELLQVMARRLRCSLRQGDTVARFGGDEFIVLLEELPGGDGVSSIAQRVMEEMSRGIVVDGRELFVTVSIGVSQYPDHGEDIDTLLRNADVALYRAKERGRQRVEYYAQEMNAHSRQRLDLESALRHALEREELAVHYQPQVDLDSGAIVGVEALLRWSHPQLGMVPAGELISLAEETGLIIPIGEWVLRSACRQAVAWRALNAGNIRMAVNLSARQFAAPDLVKMVVDVMSETGMEGGWLELELTEGSMIRNVESAIRTLHALKETGLQLAVDDFGTGYSSLAYLKRFPVDRLKIDRSFVQDLTTDPDDAAIVNGVIAMAHSLELRVVAEGVESEEHLRYLRGHRCDEGQGYYFSRPVPAEQVSPLLGRQSWWADLNNRRSVNGRSSTTCSS